MLKFACLSVSKKRYYMNTVFYLLGTLFNSIFSSFLHLYFNHVLTNFFYQHLLQHCLPLHILPTNDSLSSTSPFEVRYLLIWPLVHSRLRGTYISYFIHSSSPICYFVESRYTCTLKVRLPYRKAGRNKDAAH